MENEYDKQAIEFAEKCGLTMTAMYQGHYPRFGTNITANYRITLTRPNKTPYSFEFSTSIMDSWAFSQQFKSAKKPGLPPRIDMDAFFKEYLRKPISSFRQYTIYQTRKTPGLYDVLACLEKHDPGSFSEFCSEYGYSDDSISAEKMWRAVTEEWREVERLFSDVLDELQEIN